MTDGVKLNIKISSDMSREIVKNSTKEFAKMRHVISKTLMSNVSFFFHVHENPTAYPDIFRHTDFTPCTPTYLVSVSINVIFLISNPSLHDNMPIEATSTRKRFVNIVCRKIE